MTSSCSSQKTEKSVIASNHHTFSANVTYSVYCPCKPHTRSTDKTANATQCHLLNVKPMHKSKWYMRENISTSGCGQFPYILPKREDKIFCTTCKKMKTTIFLLQNMQVNVWLKNVEDNFFSSFWLVPWWSLQQKMLCAPLPRFYRAWDQHSDFTGLYNLRGTVAFISLFWHSF